MPGVDGVAALDRAAGALYGLAVGDALGMPTQSLPYGVVRERFGWLTGFEPAAPDHPLAAGMPAGSVTDDTGQALVLARLLLAGGGRVDPATVGGRPAGVGGRDAPPRVAGPARTLHPTGSGRAGGGRAAAAVRLGRDDERRGDAGGAGGCRRRPGARRRLAGGDVTALVDVVLAASAVTHGTSVALAGAAAVAGAVSAGVSGARFEGALAVALDASAAAAGHGVVVPAPDVGRRVAWAVDLVAGREPAEAAGDVVDLVGTGLQAHESVPAAFAAAALHPRDPWGACRFAASLGGDADTVAAMAGAVVGACAGAAALPEAACRTVDSVNGLDLAAVAAALLRLRHSP